MLASRSAASGCISEPVDVSDRELQTTVRGIRFVPQTVGVAVGLLLVLLGGPFR
jgi:hypothetical protein